MKRWMDRQGVTRIGLAYFGTADPGSYGINWTPMWGTTVPGIAPSAMGLPSLPGYVAVSVTLLDGVPFGERNRDFYKVVRQRTRGGHRRLDSCVLGRAAVVVRNVAKNSIRARLTDVGCESAFG